VSNSDGDGAHSTQVGRHPTGGRVRVATLSDAMSTYAEIISGIATARSWTRSSVTPPSALRRGPEVHLPRRRRAGRRTTTSWHSSTTDRPYRPAGVAGHVRTGLFDLTTSATLSRGTRRIRSGHPRAPRWSVHSIARGVGAAAERRRRRRPQATKIWACLNLNRLVIPGRLEEQFRIARPRVRAVASPLQRCA